MKCQLCGYQFDEKQALQVCNNCPLTSNCPLIRCPNCNYEWPKNSNITQLIPLNQLKKDNKGSITTICTTKNKQLKIIMSMGIMPGMTIQVIHRFPTMLCQIGFSQFAIDEEIARYIIVSITK